MSNSLWPGDNDRLMSVLATLVSEYGYEAVYAELHMHAPPIPSAPARPTDPDTSKAAAKTMHDIARFSIRSRQAKLLALFYNGNRYTDQQAALMVVGQFMPISALEGCRRRLSDLRASGFIRDTGDRAHNDGSGDESILSRITLAGLRAIDNLERTGWSKP